MGEWLSVGVCVREVKGRVEAGGDCCGISASSLLCVIEQFL